MSSPKNNNNGSSNSTTSPKTDVVSNQHCMLNKANNVGISHKTQRYYFARHTLLEMLTDRGYSVPLSELSLSLDDFKALFGDNPDPDSLNLTFLHTSNPSKKILVIFLGPEEIRVPRIRGVCCRIPDKESLHTLMLITESNMTAVARKELDKYSFKAEIFKIEDLFVNITKHILMPKHEILSAAEREKLLNKYNLERKQLPMMLASDAVSRYYGLEKGQVVKITYKDGIVNSIVTYRCIV